MKCTYVHGQLRSTKASALLFSNFCVKMNHLPVSYQLACAQMGGVGIFEVCPLNHDKWSFQPALVGIFNTNQKLVLELFLHEL